MYSSKSFRLILESKKQEPESERIEQVAQRLLKTGEIILIRRGKNSYIYIKPEEIRPGDTTLHFQESTKNYTESDLTLTRDDKKSSSN